MTLLVETVIQQTFQEMGNLFDILQRLENERGKEAKIALTWLYNLGTNQKFANTLGHPDLIAETLTELDEITNSARSHELGKNGVRLLLPIKDKQGSAYEIELGAVDNEASVITVDLSMLDYVPHVTLPD